MKRKRSVLETNKQTNKQKIQYFVLTKEGAPHRPEDTDVMHQSLSCLSLLLPLVRLRITAGDQSSSSKSTYRVRDTICT